MYQRIPAFVCLHNISLQQIIKEKLAKIIGLSYFDFLPLLRISQGKNCTTVVYRTAIAFPIASKTGLNSLNIAHNLVSLLSKLPPETSPSLDVSVSVLNSGMIEFSVENINIWLEFLAKNLSSNYQEIGINNLENNDLFLIKLTLKRCYSLLNLGQEQGLINLTHFESRLMSEFNPYEQQLINEFVIVIDNFEDYKNNLKLGKNLSNIFWQFERYCRIFGEVKQENIALSQIRLSLIYLTYLLLNKLIID